jgi:heme-degrading monooxygenase HmoA
VEAAALMITRIFRATVHKDLHREFEEKFLSVSIPAVKSHKGLISISVDRPTRWAPEEYVMVSTWECEDDLVGLAGERWNQAFIPKGMEKYIKECWVHHYEIFG